MRKTVNIKSLPTASRFYIGGESYEKLRLTHFALYDIWSSVVLARDTYGTAVLFPNNINVEIEVKSAKISTLKAGTKVKLNDVEYVVVEYTTNLSSKKCLLNGFVVTHVGQDPEVEVI